MNTLSAVHCLPPASPRRSAPVLPAPVLEDACSILDEVTMDIAAMDERRGPVRPVLPFRSADEEPDEATSDDEITWVIPSKDAHPVIGALPEPHLPAGKDAHRGSPALPAGPLQAGKDAHLASIAPPDPRFQAAGSAAPDGPPCVRVAPWPGGGKTLGELLAGHRDGGLDRPRIAPTAFVPPPTPTFAPALPPPLLGPARSAPAEAPPPPSDSAPPPSGKTAPVARDTAPVASERSVERCALERCAKIAARLDCQPSMRAEILASEGLDDAAWKAVEARHESALRAEAVRRKNDLLRRYDAAYVEPIEAERDPITVADYAKLAVAAERGDTGPALDALELPRTARMRVQRRWIARCAEDRTLAAQVRAAVAAARE